MSPVGSEISLAARYDAVTGRPEPLPLMALENRLLWQPGMQQSIMSGHASGHASEEVFTLQEEAEAITEISDAEEAAWSILDRPGAATQWCIVKLGGEGALLCTKSPRRQHRQTGVQVCCSCSSMLQYSQQSRQCMSDQLPAGPEGFCSTAALANHSVRQFPIPGVGCRWLSPTQWAAGTALLQR